MKLLGTKELIELNLDVPHIPSLVVIVQLVTGFSLILIGQLAAVRLRNVRISPEIKSKPFAEVFGRTDFITFNHRGSALAQRLR
eukprot:gene9559-10566_t